MKTLTLASRGSALSLAQVALTEERLQAAGVATTRLLIQTKGDADQTKPLDRIGGNGLFVREIEAALLEGKADLAVHSAKDLPYDLADGLVIGAVLPAADSADCLVWKKGTCIPEDGAGLVIGTGSARRREGILRLFPKARVANIRGNVETRLKKLGDGLFDAIVLAKAGLERLHLDLSGFEVRVFSPEEIVPAAGQGIIALECRKDDEKTLAALAAINDEKTFRRFTVERYLFQRMKADCRMAIGVHARIEGDALNLYAMFQGKRTQVEGSFGDYRVLCDRAANEIYSGVGKVYLVGAGCGAGLITVKGLSILRAADVVIYDELLDEKLLEEAPLLAERIPMGKRCHRQTSAKQDDIIAMMIEKAREGHLVVRLKGGDSFVFGRGGEEVLALQEAGIPFEVIPGVSSCIAVPEHAGIPVTHRQQARSFTVVTGHTADGGAEDPKTLAHLNGTLVYLMGMTNIGKITSDLVENGKDPKTPAAVISRGFTPEERRIDGTLENIAERAKGAALPGILVIGENAAFHMCEKTEVPLPSTPLPLAGVGVVVTGSSAFSEKTAKLLQQQGAAAMALPTIRIREIAGAVPSDVAAASWIVLTSSNGVDVLMRQLRARKVDLRSLYGVRFACLGRGTAETLSRYGIQADFVPRRFTAKDLGIELAEKIKAEKQKGRVLILRASNGSPLLTKALADAGIDYEEHFLYDTLPNAIDPAPVYSNDYLVFGSAGGVRAFFGQRDWTGRLPGKLTFVCIGEYTAQTLKQYTDQPYITARMSTAEGVAEAIEENLKKR